MKTERKQELRTNDLGAFLLDANDWTRKYIARIGVGIVIVLVVVLTLRYSQRSQSQSQESDILAMAGLSFASVDAEASFATLEDLIRDSKDPDVKMAALVRHGSAALGAAMGTDGFNPEFLDRAEQSFKELVKAYPDRTPVIGMALSSLATIEENRFVVSEDVSRKEVARDYLTRLKNDAQFKGTPFQVGAADRLLHLDETFEVIAIAESPAIEERQSFKIESIDSPPWAKPKPAKPLDEETVTLPSDSDVGPPLPNSLLDRSSQPTGEDAQSP